jgi:probable addiction module antidote protein
MSGTMAEVETHAHDAANYVESAENAVLHLEAALEDGDPRVVAEMIGAIARSRGMQVAEATGLSRESLYRALSAKGNPTLSTTLRVLKALGLRLTVTKPKLVA